MKKAETPNNERLEFLGDAVLSVIVTDHLYRSYYLDEGELTKLRAAIVCEHSLCHMAETIGLGNFIRLGRGEELMDGRHRPSIQADAFEALIAAIYLDGSIVAATAFVLPFVENMLKKEDKLSQSDYKTMLQEIVQQNAEEKLSYVVADESGPDHAKHFVVEVHLNSNVIGTGSGTSKKAAEQMAAREALHLMGR